jgi:hypothetical protein
VSQAESDRSQAFIALSSEIKTHSHFCPFSPAPTLSTLFTKHDGGAQVRRQPLFHFKHHVGSLTLLLLAQACYFTQSAGRDQLGFLHPAERLQDRPTPALISSLINPNGHIIARSHGRRRESKPCEA